MYVNYGPIPNRNAADLISLVIDNIERIEYTGYYNGGSTFTIYPHRIITPGNYPPELLNKRKLSVHEVRCSHNTTAQLREIAKRKSKLR